MLFSDRPAAQMLQGNLLLTGCCVFYLLWWIVAFRPHGAVRGFRSGWLLLPALVLGCAAVLRIVQGAGLVKGTRSFFSAPAVLLAGVVSYAALLLLTGLVLHRQVTTELFLIVGWTALAFLEGNALYGLDLLSRRGTVVLFAAAVLVAAVSMVCYLAFYHLDGWPAYLDGMLPLLLVGLFMALLAGGIALRAP